MKKDRRKDKTEKVEPRTEKNSHTTQVRGTRRKQATRHAPERSNKKKEKAKKMSSDEENDSEEVQFFELLEKNCTEALQLGLLGSGITTMDMLLAQHGMGEDHPQDAAVTAVLQKAKSIKDEVELDMAGGDANSLRLLHRKGTKAHSTPPSKKAKSSHATSGAAAEDAEDTRVATKAFAFLKRTQNVDIPIHDQMHHNLIHTLTRSLETTGTIHYAWEMKFLRREGEKRLGFRKIKNTSFYEEDVGFRDDDEGISGGLTGP